MLFSPLCSGSSGNASYLEAGGVRLLVVFKKYFVGWGLNQASKHGRCLK